MKTRFLLILTAGAAALAMSLRADACTNVIVTPGASADGSAMVSYAADSHWLFGELYFLRGGKWKAGAVRQIVDWDSNKPLGQIPQAPVTYQRVGNMNVHQVAIGETTWGGREELMDPAGVMDYGSLIYVALERARTAREAIEVIVSLANEYGYASEGETFSIIDPHEAWIMDLIGKGPDNRGIVWVARRIPDGYISGHANQSRITRFPLDDPETLYAPDVISFAREKGYFSGEDAEFSYREAYCPIDFGEIRGCDARVWSMFRLLGGSGFDSDRYLTYAMGYDVTGEMPLWIKPDHKVDVQEVMNLMRDHYEGTPLALDSADIGGGIWQMPYRPTPLSFKVDGKSYFNERPTSTQQTGFSYVSQMRSWLPREIGGILWFGNDDGNMVAYTPVYCSMTEQPECYNTPGADAVNFSDKNAYWVCNWVSNMVYPRYSQMFPSLETVRDSLDNSYFALQNQIEEEAMRLYSIDKQKAVRFLNDYSIEKAHQMLSRWKQLAVYLIVKYNDMAVKPEENGKFKLTDTGLGARVKRTGYPESFAKKLVESTGSKYAMPEK